MMTSTSKLTRLALAGFAVLCLGSSVLAGPGAMYMMIHGKMMMVTPMTKDVTCKNGCKICCDGTMTMGGGKPVKLKEGDAVSAEGVMVPGGKKGH